jgi:hypothetical protein
MRQSRRRTPISGLFVNHDPKRQHLSEKKMVENGST